MEAHIVLLCINTIAITFTLIFIFISEDDDIIDLLHLLFIILYVLLIFNIAYTISIETLQYIALKTN